MKALFNNNNNKTWHTPPLWKNYRWMKKIHSSTNYLTSDGCPTSMNKGRERKEITLFAFSFCKITLLVAYAPRHIFHDLQFSVFCALLAVLTIGFNMLIGILPNSQKADHGISAVLAEWVPLNAGGQRTTDSLWKTLASVRRQPQIYLINFMFHSTSFHLYCCRLNIQTGTQFCRNLSVNSTPFRALQWAATLLWLGYQKRKRRRKKKKRKDVSNWKKILKNLEHTLPVLHI